MSILKRIIEFTALDFHKELPIDVLVRLFLTNVLSFLIIFAATIFVFVSINNGAIILAYFLLALIAIHILNIVVFIWKRNIALSQYIVVLSLELLFIILVFNGGKVGYGYLWFFGFPIVSTFLLGKNIGRIVNLSFLFFLISLLFIPSYYFAFEYNYSLIYRLIFSYFVISLIVNFIVVINHKIIFDLKQKVSLNSDIFDDKKELFLQLSKQSKITFNSIYSITNKIKKSTNTLDTQVETLQDYTINLENIMNNIIELSEIDKSLSNNTNHEFNLLNTIDNTIKIFTNKRFNINIVFASTIPNIVVSNPLDIKQILFNILKSIKKHSNSSAEINIEVESRNIQSNIIDLRFKISLNKNILNSLDRSLPSSNNIHLQSVEEYIDFLNLASTNALIIKYGGYLFIDNNFNGTIVKFSSKFNISTNKKQNLSDILLQTPKLRQNIISIKTSKLEDKRVLFVDDDVLSKKIVQIELGLSFKKLDFADNYKNALTFFSKNKYDAIIVNNSINNVSCISFIQKIRDLDYGINMDPKIIIIGDKNSYINVLDLSLPEIIDFQNKKMDAKSILEIL